MGKQRDFINSILSEVAPDCIDKIRWSNDVDVSYSTAFKNIKRDFVLYELVPALNSGKFVVIRDTTSKVIGAHTVSYFISQDTTVEWKIEKLQEAIDL